jgi:hypothetical protein
MYSVIQGEHTVFPWLQTFITRNLRGIQTYFLPLLKLNSKILLELSYMKKKYFCIPYSFLVINVCNQEKNLRSPCTYLSDFKRNSNVPTNFSKKIYYRNSRNSGSCKLSSFVRTNRQTGTRQTCIQYPLLGVAVRMRIDKKQCVCKLKFLVWLDSLYWTKVSSLLRCRGNTHTTLTRERHPFLRRDLNPQSQKANGRRSML